MLPPGKRLLMNLEDGKDVAALKKNPITIKEAVDFK